MYVWGGGGEGGSGKLLKWKGGLGRLKRKETAEDAERNRKKNWRERERERERDGWVK